MSPKKDSEVKKVVDVKIVEGEGGNPQDQAQESGNPPEVDSEDTSTPPTPPAPQPAKEQPISRPTNKATALTGFENLEGLVEEATAAVSETPELLETALIGSDSAGEAKEEVCRNVMFRVQKEATGKDKVLPTPPMVFMATALLCQKGATSPRTPGSMKVTIGRHTFTTDMLRKSCSAEKITTRQFARGQKTHIANWLLSQGDSAPDGNLARTMALELKNITKAEAVWASDFQTYNPECPTRVRNWLVKNYRARFRK